METRKRQEREPACLHIVNKFYFLGEYIGLLSVKKVRPDVNLPLALARGVSALHSAEVRPKLMKLNPLYPVPGKSR
jgi:hypothetical protein